MNIFSASSLMPFFLAQDEAAPHANSLLTMIRAGGIVGWVLIALSVVALTMIIMYVVQIRRKVLVPPQHVEVLAASASSRWIRPIS